MNNKNKTARLAGLLYFLYIVITILAVVIGRSNLIVAGDAVTTANNIVAAAGTFRLGIVTDLVSGLFFLLAAWALYALLKSVQQELALLFLVLNAAGVAVYSLNLLNQFAVLVLLSGAGYLQVFRPDQLQAMAMFFLNLYTNGYWISQLFFAAWLLPLGYLVYKSGFIPRILGIIMLIHFVGWMLTFVQYFLFPGLDVIHYVTYPLGFISEFGLALWLLIMGAREQKTE